MSIPRCAIVHAALVPTADGGQQPHLGLVAKRQYRLQGGTLVAPASAPLDIDPVYVNIPVDAEPDGVEDAMLLRDSELLCMLKQNTDVLLSGSAYALRGPVQELVTKLVVGKMSKTVLVSGHRSLLVSVSGSVAATSAVPFERMPLSWLRAYGGRDRGSEAPPPPPRRGQPSPDDILAHGANAYPRNRHGCGFFIDCDRQRLHGSPLPTQSDPADPLTLARMFADDPYDWLDRPGAASYGPMDMVTFPRCLFLGLEIEHAAPRAPVHEVLLGALQPHELALLDHNDVASPRVFNCAAPGLGNVRLRGDEHVQLHNLHRDAEHYVFALPGERPRLIIEPPNAGTFELDAKLATVLIEPDEDRVTLTWAGSVPAAEIYPPAACAEVRHAVIWN